MNDIYVFNRDLEIQGIIDEYISLIWRPSYNEVGDFEIYMGASAKAVELLQPNRYVVRSSDISVGEGDNILDITVATQTIHGVTFTVNDDGSITIDGTASDNAYLSLKRFSPSEGIYIYSGCPAGGSTSTYYAYINHRMGETYVATPPSDVGNGSTYTVDYSNYDTLDCGIGVKSGTTVSNLTFYPELRKQNVATYKNVMVIKNIQLTTDIENGDFLCVTGRELKHLLHQRIIWANRTTSDTVEYVLRNLISYNAVAPVDERRTIPNMAFTEAKGYGGDTISVQPDHVQLDEAVIDICKTYNYGWDIYISDGLLMVDIYQGTDRSYGQTERPYVVFSENFENLYGTEYVYESEGYSNSALIGGEESEDRTRIYATANYDVTGLDRYEVFVDGSDISQTIESEDTTEEETEELMSDEEYRALLEERGLENLATLTISEGFTGEVLNDVAFSYGKDFYLGDIVTVINKYGMTKNVRVLSAIESEDESGVKLLPQFSV